MDTKLLPPASAGSRAANETRRSKEREGSFLVKLLLLEELESMEAAAGKVLFRRLLTETAEGPKQIIDLTDASRNSELFNQANQCVYERLENLNPDELEALYSHYAADILFAEERRQSRLNTASKQIGSQALNGC